MPLGERLINLVARSTDDSHEREAIDKIVDGAAGVAEAVYETQDRLPEARDSLLEKLKAPAKPKLKIKKEKTMSDLDKRADEMLKEAAERMEGLEADLKKEQEKSASLERQLEAHKLAFSMRQSGIIDYDELEEKTAELMEEEDLDLTAKMMEKVARHGGGDLNSFLKVASDTNSIGEGGTTEERQAAIKDRFYQNWLGT